MEMGKWYNHGKVELRFEILEGEDRKKMLYMKKYRKFVDKATKAINQSFIIFSKQSSIMSRPGRTFFSFIKTYGLIIII